MSVKTIIRDRSEKKELRMNEGYILQKSEVIEKGFTYLGSLGQAHLQGYRSMRECENSGESVSPEELENIKHYAMCKSFYADNLPTDAKRHKRFCPCIPVFYRNQTEK